MVGDIMQPTHLLFVLLVALLVLGPKRLPEVGRTLGSGIRDFRQALSGESTDHRRSDEAQQVPDATSEPRGQAHPPTDEEIAWPEEAVGPSSYDEAVDAASPEWMPAATGEPVIDHESQHGWAHERDAPEFADAVPATETGSAPAHSVSEPLNAPAPLNAAAPHAAPAPLAAPEPHPASEPSSGSRD